jgi:hypothetical protein
MVPLFEESPLSVEAIVSGEQPIKSMIGEDISEVDSMGFYYWLEIYDVELVANND